MATTGWVVTTELVCTRVWLVVTAFELMEGVVLTTALVTSVRLVRIWALVLNTMLVVVVKLVVTTTLVANVVGGVVTGVTDPRYPWAELEAAANTIANETMRQHRLAWAGRDTARARQVIKDFMGIDPREAGRPVVRWDARAAVNFVNIFTADPLHVPCRGPRRAVDRLDSALLLGFFGTFESGQPQSPEQEGDAFTVLKLNLEKDTASAFRSAG